MGLVNARGLAGLAKQLIVCNWLGLRALPSACDLARAADGD